MKNNTLLSRALRVASRRCWSTRHLRQSTTTLAANSSSTSAALSWCQPCTSYPSFTTIATAGTSMVPQCRTTIAATRTSVAAIMTTRRRLSTEDNNNNDDNQQQEQGATTLQVTSNNDTVSLEIPGTRAGKTGRQLAIVFTCAVCEMRSAKQFTENAYLHGVVLVRCPGCQNLHLIADRLGWFDDTESHQFDLTVLEQMTGQKVHRIGDNKDGGVSQVSLQDLVGKEKMQQILQAHQEQQVENDKGEDKPKGS